MWSRTARVSRRERRGRGVCRLLTLALIGAAIAVLQASVPSTAPASSSATGKKRCKIVVRKVHGKKKRVRVCHTVKPPLPSGARLVATIAIGQPVTLSAVAADGASVWLLDIYNGRALRVDPSTNAVVASLPRTPISDGDVAIGFGAVWETDFASDALLRINPATNQIVATIPLGDDAAPEGVGIASGSVWVANHHLGTVSRIDPSTNSVVATISISSSGTDGPLELAAGATGVWVTVRKTAEVVHIDPATNSVVGRVQELGPAIVDGDRVWIERPFSLDRVDPTTNKIVKRVAVPQTVGRGGAGLGSVWIPTKPGLARVNESTGKLTGLRKGVPAADTAAVGGDSIWLASTSRGQLFRYSPT